MEKVKEFSSNVQNRTSSTEASLEPDQVRPTSDHIGKLACSSCKLRDVCMPVGLNPEELNRLDQLVSMRKKVKKGQALFRAGDAFNAFYAIRLGTFKSRVHGGEGKDQVTGFQMAGEILGLEGISMDKHACDAVALEDSEVCVIDYQHFQVLANVFPSLQKHFHRVMSREIVRDRNMMMLLGSMSAEQRLAAFLLNLVQRQQARGFSGQEMMLRMTREEIGNYLGLKLETVSRTLSKLQDEALIQVEQRHIKILEPAALRALIGTPE
jgi:CRP/FNR family transcriptional regulator